MKYTGYKYSGGTFCGLIEDRDSIDEVMSYADDGFCDYVRIVGTREDGSTQLIKVHFEPTERDEDWYMINVY